MLQSELLDCSKGRYHGQKFAPIEHDLITVSQNGKVQIAKNAPAAEIKRFLGHCNGDSARDMEGVDLSPILTLIRLEEAAKDIVVEQHQSHIHESTINDEWSELWPILECSEAEKIDLEFVSRIRRQRLPCKFLVKPITINRSIKTVCRKLSYNINLQKKCITLSHHLHNMDGEVKAMARMVTCGVSLKIAKEIVSEILILLKDHSPGSESADTESILPVPHPKTIACGIVDYFEDISSEDLAGCQKHLEEIESSINKQRDPESKERKGLETNYIKLSETIMHLSEIGQKQQKMEYLLSKIAAVDDNKGNPNPRTGMKGDCEIPENQIICSEWGNQLNQVNERILELKERCQQHNLSIEGLQKRVKVILNIVSVLRAERENTQMLKTRERRHKTLMYQTSMLEKQDIIVVKTKRDNTVMKVIALLTALFLPGTFIATLFSVPIFQWDQENPIGPHFRTYWYFTIPITTVLVVGFSAWFLKNRYDDQKEQQGKVNALEDPEKAVSLTESEPL